MRYIGNNWHGSNLAWSMCILIMSYGSSTWRWCDCTLPTFYYTWCTYDKYAAQIAQTFPFVHIVQSRWSVHHSDVNNYEKPDWLDYTRYFFQPSVKLIKAHLNSPETFLNSFELFVFCRGADMFKVLITSCDKVFGTSHLLGNVFASRFKADARTQQCQNSIVYGPVSPEQQFVSAWPSMCQQKQELGSIQRREVKEWPVIEHGFHPLWLNTQTDIQCLMKNLLFF